MGHYLRTRANHSPYWRANRFEPKFTEVFLNRSTPSEKRMEESPGGAGFYKRAESADFPVEAALSADPRFPLMAWTCL